MHRKDGDFIRSEHRHSFSPTLAISGGHSHEISLKLRSFSGAYKRLKEMGTPKRSKIRWKCRCVPHLTAFHFVLVRKQLMQLGLAAALMQKGDKASRPTREVLLEA